MPTGDRFRIAIRSADADDAPRCAEIFLHGRRSAFSWHPADRFGLDDYYDCVQEDAVLVAETQNGVVGFVSIDATAGFIHNLFIDAAWHNRGIGSALLRAAVERLHGSALLACAARNAAARAFYEHKGWTPVHRPYDPPDPLVLYRMEPVG